MSAAAIVGAAAGTIGAAKAAPSKMKFWAAATTPCDKNLKLDLGAMREQVEWYKSHGADGLTFLGSTGEFTAFTMAEHKALMEVVGRAKGNLNVLCTASTANVPDTIELCKHAADHGADGVIVSPPYYVKGISTEGMLRYYTMVLDGLPKNLSFYLYHVPRWSAVPIPVELVEQLRRYGNVAGLKDSTTDAKGYTNFVTKFPDMSVITGTYENLEIALNHGMGGIIQEAGPYCRDLADLFAVARSGKDFHGPYAALQAKIAQLYGPKDGLDQYGIMQYAMTTEMGKPASFQRPPFVDLSDARKAEIEETLREQRVKLGRI
ncbi:MAG TPA: dihydrodipicolinate synthase family protein [Rhizomicrobium sp.]|nr:dihydrodipicolinate synthase family protein [Rhizomicrobium sp.]